jgi:hypothetical protein
MALTQGQVRSFTLAVPAGTRELKATLAWDDAAGTAFAAQALVNDLTLELVGPGNVVHRAWVLDPGRPVAPATRGANTRDNQEQVVVDTPAAGTWTVRVVGTSVPTGPQLFALAYGRSAPYTTTCASRAWTFDSGLEDWSTSGTAGLFAAPGSGHGAYSLWLGGGAGGTTDAATLEVLVPASSAKAELSYWWHMTTQEVPDTELDSFYLEVRDTAGAVQAVLDRRTEGWPASQWMRTHVDLAPWAGRTVRLAVVAVNSANGVHTSFYVDDVTLTTCRSATPTLTVDSTGAQDGRIAEISPIAEVGGTATNGDSGGSALRVGDVDYNGQYRSILSFDTSSLPDDATVTSAVLHLTRGGAGGATPFASHGPCRVDVKTGTFGATGLQASDFEAAPTAAQAGTLTAPAADGSWSEAALSAAGRAAINRAGATQMRIYCQKGDDGDGVPDFVGFYSGEHARPEYRPRLDVQYIVLPLP